MVSATVVVASSCATSPPAYVGESATASQVGSAVPAHPHMAATVSNSMHGDAANTDAHTPVGPLGARTRITDTSLGGLCAAQAFDSAGRLFTVCGSLQGFSLQVIDPATMRRIASRSLPQRPSTIQALLEGDVSLIFTDTSGGAYFYLDDSERVVLVDAEQVLRVIALDTDGPTPRLVDVASYPLEGHLVDRDCFSIPTNLDPLGHCDVVTSVMPDWTGRYWFVSRRGVVGTVDPSSGRVSSIRLDEEVENSMAVDADGVFVVSDVAVYGLRADAGGEPEQMWREEYDHSGGPRPGQLSVGSGTTPTLLGDDLLAITDGADPVNVVVVDRSPGVTGGRTMCSTPVFERGASASEDSLVTDGYSVTVQNTYGYDDLFSLPPGTSVPGGIRRIDVDSVSRTCSIGWSSSERVPSSAMKLSLGAGLLYGYTKEPDQFGRDLWYWTAIDWRTGRTVHQVLAGVGPQWNNNWGVISIGPDGSAYMGTMSGLLRIRDA